jgi:hypothetical protein
MSSVIKVDQIQSDQGVVNVSSNLQFSSGYTMLSGTFTTPTLNSPLISNGIRFPSTPTLSADGNTLDDYEEGTWTPSVNTLGTVTYNSWRHGFYTKIGNRVHVSFMVGFSTNDGTQDSNALYITGLPYTAESIGGGIWSQGAGAMITEGLYASLSNSGQTPTIVGIAYGGTATIGVMESSFNTNLASRTYMSSALRTMTKRTDGNMYFCGQLHYQTTQ